MDGVSLICPSTVLQNKSYGKAGSHIYIIDATFKGHITAINSFGDRRITIRNIKVNDKDVW